MFIYFRGTTLGRLSLSRGGLEPSRRTNHPHFDIPDNYPADAGSINQATGRVTQQGDFMPVTGVTNLAREGIDERQFRIGLRIGF